jgi:chromosome segregation ATPase
MALPGMRGYGREDNWGGGRNSSYGRKKDNVQIGSDNTMGFSRLKTGGGSSDPALGRRLDGLETRVGQQDSASRAVLEQLMRLQQDFKVEIKKHEQLIAEERNQRMRMESVVNGAVNKQGELEERLRRNEDSCKENKSALSQLISHTQNVERAVISGQQDMVTKKEQQGKKIQELYHKMASVQSNRETLERTCYNLRDEVKEMEGKVDTLGMEVKDFEGAVKMQGAMMDKLASSRSSKHKEKEGKETKMTETQRAMLEAKIMQVVIQREEEIASPCSPVPADHPGPWGQARRGEEGPGSGL